MIAPADFINELVARRLVSERDSKELIASYRDDLFAMVLHLVRRQPKNRDELGRFWGNCLGVAYVDPSKTLIQYELISRLPEAFAKSRRVLPLYEMGGAVTVATPTPTDKALITEIESYLDTFVSPVFAFPDQITATLEIGYQSHTALEAMLMKKFGVSGARTSAISAEELQALSEDKAIIAFANGLLLLALKNRASDIHIEPGPHEVRVRFRIDGVLQELFKLERALHPPIVTRLKVMAEANIAESRRPQEGRIQLKLPDHVVDVRFSCLPTVHGEKVAMRILGQSHFLDVPDLDELAFSARALAALRKVLELPNGIFFVTGPTGSGKTTTLYAMLKYLNDPSLNITTIEDPVEYTLEGLNQVLVNEAVGLTFAPALRFFLRQDPDVILVGEIRDLETATIATRAALTGHLVLTTMHTNTALQVVTRLLDLGADPALLAPSIVGVLAQRLVRRLCEYCKQPREATDEEMNRFFEWDGKTRPILFQPRGCERCGRIGYLGRLAIHEIFLINEETRALIARRASAPEIEAHALQHGFTTMFYDGLKKVLRGLTTFDEINRVVIED